MFYFFGMCCEVNRLRGTALSENGHWYPARDRFSWEIERKKGTREKKRKSFLPPLFSCSHLYVKRNGKRRARECFHQSPRPNNVIADNSACSQIQPDPATRSIFEQTLWVIKGSLWRVFQNYPHWVISKFSMDLFSHSHPPLARAPPTPFRRLLFVFFFGRFIRDDPPLLFMAPKLLIAAPWYIANPSKLAATDIRERT